MEEKMITATKTQICEKYIKEADKVITFLDAFKNFCNAVILEEEQEECGCYRGDGANDPENICRACPKFYRPAQSVMLLNTELQPAEDSVKDNDFLQLVMMVPTLLELIDNHDHIKFPAHMFPQENPNTIDVQDLVLFSILRRL